MSRGQIGKISVSLKAKFDPLVIQQLCYTAADGSSVRNNVPCVTNMSLLTFTA